MNPKSSFIPTAAIVAISASIIGLSAAQPANEKKITVYWADFSAPLELTVVRLSKNCEDRREFLATDFGVTSDPCYERSDKVDKH